MVAFVDPRKSKIDIAQAAGRAMRQSKATNKKLGYIVVPLFIEQKKGETEAEAFTRADFDEVAEVLGAMLESDDNLVDTIKELQEARGRGDKFNPRQLHEKIEVIGPAINLDKLTQSIDVEILECLGHSWDKSFGLLQKFHNEHGHSRVTRGQKFDGLNLDIWIATQRGNKGRLSDIQISKLNSIDFSWDPQAEDWEEGFAALKKFRDREGHCRVPETYKEADNTLGRWVKTQRDFRKRNCLNSERYVRLNALGFSWDPQAEDWEEGFAALKKFRDREGHCRVPQGMNENGFPLGSWVMNQRKLLRTDGSDLARIKRLKSIGFSWDPFAEAWEIGFAELKKFRKLEGNCRVPQDFVQNGIKLGWWIVEQRKARKAGLLHTERKKRLDALGFSWDPQSDKWDEAFAILKKFLEREGHCRVGQTQIVDGFGLGTWVYRQRNNKDDLSDERIRRLNKLGFAWRTP